jgi:hypothetical protein
VATYGRYVDALVTGILSGLVRYAKGTPHKVINDYLAIAQADIAHDKWTDPDAGSEVFRDYAEEWLARAVRQNRIRPTTADKYTSLLNLHLLPTFGNLHLRKITGPTRWSGESGF